MIGPFREEYYFLSNFYPVQIRYHGSMWSTAEHLYQAMKTLVPEEREFIRLRATPGMAKRVASHGNITLRGNWDQIKEEVMVRLIALKFKPGTELAQLLIDTGNEELVEINWWHDTFWGRCTCNRCNNQGDNKLGEILMAQRTKLMENNNA